MMPDAGSIKKHLGALSERLDIKTAEITGSTNDDVKRLAHSGAAEGTVVIAGAQTAGRGRLGRSFYSPDSTGIYMSVLLRPALPLPEAQLITVCAACAVSEATDRVCGVSTGIKWVNDIYLGGKKVCGILTESSASGSTADCAVLGIGINVSTADFPDDIKNIAGGLGAVPEKIPELTAEVLKCFFGYYDRLPEKAFMERYRQRSILIGRYISFERNGEVCSARAVGIDDCAGLEIITEKGEKQTLRTGEVSVRLS